MPDFLPRRESDLISFLEVFVNWVVLNQVALGLTVQQVNDLVAAHTALLASWSAYLVAQDGAESATADKNTTKDALIEHVRMINTMVHANPDVTPAMLEAGGLQVRDDTPTPLDPSVVENANPPQLFLEAARGVVVVHFGPAPETEGTNKKPFGIQGALIHCAVGGDPAEVEGAGPWQTVAMDTNSPYNHIDAATENVTLVYKAQWMDKLGRLGRFCDPVTIAYTKQ